MSISGTIPNVIGGISQQPPAARLENTASDLQNAIASVVSGLRKRSPTKWVGTLMPEPTSSVALFKLERSGKPLKFLSIADGTLKVFDTSGNSETVTTVGAAGSYLTSSDPEADFGFLAIADTVFVYNKSKTVATSATTETRDDPEDQVTFVVENTSGQTTYKINVNGQEGTYTVTTNNEAANKVALELVNSFNGAGGLVAVQRSNTITVKGPNVSTYDFEAEPGSLIRTYRDTVQKFSHLPPYETDGRLVKVAGDPDEAGDAYWVTYDKNTRIWSETSGFNATGQLDVTTMPHVLMDNGDGTWDFQAHTWNTRDIGDDDTNPHPSFVGFEIFDMFLTSNRMCILADENFISSEVGTYENFYRTTCTTLVDSDRIDVAALSTDNRVARLYSAIEFDEQLLIFSDRQQFKMDTSNGISPNTVNLRPTTSYSASTQATPAKLGNNVVFVDDADNSAWADLREYLVDNVVGVNTSEIITKQVPEFIPTGVTSIVTNPTLGMCLVFTQGDRNKVFIYSYFTANGEKVQSAWTYWSDDNVEFLNGFFVGTRMYLVGIRDGQLNLYLVDLQETVSGDFDGLEVMLDYRVTNPSVIFDGTNSTVTLPYETLPGEEYVAVLTVDGVDTAGTAYEASATSSNTVTFPNIDLSGESLMVGRKYTFLYELSPIFLRDDGKVPIQDGRLQLRYLSFLYHQTSYFRVEVTPPGRGPYTAVFAGRVLGRLTDIVGEVAVDDGEFRVASSGQADRVTVKIINDSPFNCRFSSIEWEGAWRPKTKRMR